MHFSENDIERFAAWSGDHNPLHVDPEFARSAGYKQEVVHGVLLAIGALGSVRSRSAAPLNALEIEFRGVVHPDAACDMEAVLRADDLSISLRQHDAEVAFLLGEFGGKTRSREEVDLSWIRVLEARFETEQFGKRAEPAHIDFADLHSGMETMGVYATDPPPEAATASGFLKPIQARVLGLCSYLSGMELPGLRSLSTRLSLQFAAPEIDENVLWYRARVIRLDRQSRILETSLEISTPDGRLVATGELHSYLRFTPAVIDFDSLAARVKPAARQLAGKVALVCGGSRGLGANLAAALALAGCRVYASYRNETAAAEQLAKKLTGRGLAVEFLQGDAGNPAWCVSAFELIRARHGQLDILALNACTPPATYRLTADRLPQFDQYVISNLRLASTPLATFLPLLDESRGTVICSSSSFVTDPQPGLAHFVALKQAVEGTLCAALRDASNVDAIIVRSPKLLTSSNDSPAGACDAIATDQVAEHIVGRLAGQWRPGRVEILSRFSAPGTESDVLEEYDPVIETEPALDTPDHALEAIDALIVNELDRTSTTSFDSESVLDDIFERPLLPGSTEKIPLRAPQDAPVSESATSASQTIDAPVSNIEPTTGDRPEVDIRLPELTVEQRLNELLDVLQTEAEGQVAIPASDESCLEETFHEMGIGSNLDSVETDLSLPVRTIEILPETQACLPAEEAPLEVAAAESPVALEPPAEEEAASALQVVVESEDVAAAENVFEQERHSVLDESTAPEGASAPDVLPYPEVAAVVEEIVEEAKPVDANSRQKAIADNQEPERSEAVIYSARAEPIEITGFTSDTESDLYEFHQQAFPDERKDRFISRWLWKHVESARRLAIEPRVWLCRQRGAVVAHNGAISIKLKIGDAEQLVAWIGDTASIDTLRREDVDFRLLSQVSEELPFCLSLGQSEKTRTTLLQMGWVQVAPLTTAQFVIHPEAVQQGRLSGPAALAAGWGSRVTSAVRTLLNHRPTMEIRQVARFDGGHDKLWHIAAREITCGVIRDAAYLNWKYVDQPGQDILRLELIEQGTVCGVVILQFCEANDNYPYRHAFLADLVSPLSDERLLQQLVQIASTAAAERNTDALVCQYVCAPLTRILRQNGFRMYEPDQYLLVNPRQLPLESRVKVLAGKDWFVMPGDADFCQ